MSATIVFAQSTPTFAWSYITHHYLTEQTLGVNAAMAGLGPDMLNKPDQQLLIQLSRQFTGIEDIWEDYPVKKPDGTDYDWPDFVHSPNPRIVENKRLYSNSPNFAYLLNLYYSSYYDEVMAEGWGSHIAADWVSHSDNLFPIASSTVGDISHLIGETLYDLYVLSEKEEQLSFAGSYNPSQIRKALVSYRLIDIHKSDPIISEYTAKNDALQTSLPVGDISTRAKHHIKLSSLWETFLTGISSTMSLLNKKSAFISYMKAQGADDNLELSKEIINRWKSNNYPRGNIPLEEINERVKSFQPLSGIISKNMEENNSGKSFLARIKDFFFGLSWANAQEPEAPDILDSTTLRQLLLSLVLSKAEAENLIQVTEIYPDEKNIGYSVQISDQERVRQIFNEIADELLEYPVIPELGRVASLVRNLSEGMVEPDLLADTTPPTITDVQSHGLEPAIIKATIVDNLGGIGIDEEGISVKLNDEPVSYNFDSETGELSVTIEKPLSGSTNQVTIYARDLAYNQTSYTFDLITDVTPPQTIHFVTHSPDGNNNWYLTLPGIVLLATDDFSSNIKTYYAWGNEEFREYNGEMIFPAKGINSLNYFSTDEYGNKEEEKTIVFQYDPDPPIISNLNPLNDSYLINYYYTVSYSVSDELSGLYSAFAKLNDRIVGNNKNYALTEYGANKFVIYAEDKAGNISIYDKNFKIDYEVNWLPPLDMKPLNTGSTLPIKFNVKDFFGNPIIDKTVVVKVGNPSFYATFSYSNGGSSNIRIDESSGQYILNFHMREFGWIKSNNSYKIEVYFNDLLQSQTQFTTK